MEAEKAKLFVGGISRETSEEALTNHFSKYGHVLGSLVAKDRNAGNPRGFGFVWFSETSFADEALKDAHVILGRTVEVKKAIPRGEQHQYNQEKHLVQQQYQPNQLHGGLDRTGSTGDKCEYFRTKKIFVGGLSANLTQERFKNYFEKFGRIMDVVVMQDSSTNRPRGFGFVTFDSEESVDRVMVNTFHELNGRLVEVKRAVPKERIKNSNSSCVTAGAINGTYDKANQLGKFFSYGPEHETFSGYAPLPVYSSVGGYLYGTSVYPGGYSVVGYGRPGFAATPIAPGGPWNGPVMVGSGLCPFPYGNGCIYPAYMYDAVGVMGAMEYNKIPRPTVTGKVNEILGGSGYLLPDNMPQPTEGLKTEVDSSDLNSNGSASS
ncbi:hypothetical protein K2173_028460 [Erythroxylum novogranatense]|uniref:RRM domain-containing protein n=1 Tax=Erythroxylum novogranatense TaxID=1862640 RepID=A0AAV8U5Z6_9ROSI|nr:hypothetical protein K2173_028460 [Erythroxylum novogranatense]